MNFKCKKCGHVTGSNPGMWAHLSSHHNLKTMTGNFEMTEEKPVRKYKRKSDKIEKKSKKIIKTIPSIKYITIPITLKIPIEIGEVILAETEE